jgi:hypothetical protein
MNVASQSRSLSPLMLLPTDRRIIEKRFMEYRPFGTTPQGEPIRDVSGVKLEKWASREKAQAQSDSFAR